MTSSRQAAWPPLLQGALVLAAVWSLAGCGGGGGGGGGGAGTSTPPGTTIDVSSSSCTGGAGQGWCWQAPRPWGHAVKDVRFTSLTDGWAVGDSGLLLRTRDGGANWDSSFMPGAPTLVGMRFATDGRQGWLLGAEGGRLWRTVDGGANWTLATAVPVDLATSLERTDNGTLVATGIIGGATYTARVSDDGGNSWRDPGSGFRLIDADGAQWNELLVSQNPNRLGLRRSTDAGLTFSRQDDWPAGGEPGSLAVFTGGYAWLTDWTFDEAQPGLPSGYLLRPGAGRPWQAAPSAPDGASIGWYDAQGLWASHGQDIWHAKAGGLGWSAVARPIAGRWWEQGFVDGSTLWLRDDDAGHTVWITADGGARWLKTSIADELDALGQTRVARDGGGALLLARGAGPTETPLLWHRSTDQGRSWTALPGAQNRALGSSSALWMLDRQRGLILTTSGQLLETDDGGRHWRAGSATLPAGKRAGGAMALQFTPAGTGWALQGGRLFRSRDAGRNWAESVLPAGSFTARSLQFIDDRTAFLLVGRLCPGRFGPYDCQAQVFVTEDAAQSWASVGPAWSGSGSLHMQDRRRGVRDHGGELAYTNDGGATWVPATVPQAASDSLPDVSIVRHVLSNGVRWALRPYGLLRSADGGTSWDRVALPLPLGFGPQRGFALNDLVFADASRGWIVGAGGLVLATTDGGQTWQRQPSGSERDLQRVFALNANAVWIAGAYGVILASVTGGR